MTNYSDFGAPAAQHLTQRLGSGDGETLTSSGEELREIHKVPAVGVERIAARALFGGEHVEKQADQPGVRFPRAHSGIIAPIS